MPAARLLYRGDSMLINDADVKVLPYTARALDEEKTYY